MMDTSLKVGGIASAFATQAMFLQTLLWIRLVLLIFTLLSQSVFAPPMQFSLSCMVYSTLWYSKFPSVSEPDKSLWWLLSSMCHDQIPHTCCKGLRKLRGSGVLFSPWKWGSSLGAVRAKTWSWGSPSQGAVREEIKVTLCRAEKNERPLKRICHNFATSSGNGFWSGIISIVLWVKANFPFKALYI